MDVRNQMKPIKRGDIYFARLNPTVGSEQGDNRPVIVVQNDVGNRYSPTFVIVPLTCNLNKKPQSTHVLIQQCDGLESDSLALTEQVRTIDRSRFERYIGRINKEQQFKIDTALAICVGIEKRLSAKGELFELCLCPRCKNNFKDSGYVVVKKGWQAIQEDCDFYKSRRGVTFGIFNMAQTTSLQDRKGVLS